MKYFFALFLCNYDLKTFLLNTVFIIWLRMSKTYVFLGLYVYGTPLNRLTDLHTPDDALLTWLQQAQATFLPHLTFTVVIVDSYRETQSTGFGTGAPGRCLDQAVLLPCYRTIPVSFQYYSVNNILQNGVGWAPLYSQHIWSFTVLLPVQLFAFSRF